MANAKRIALLGGVCLVVVWFLLMPTSRVDRLTLPSCLDPVEAVFVAEVVDWPEQVRGIPSLRPEQVISVPTDVVGLMSPWTTDSWVFGWRGGRPTVACIPGPRGLAEWGENYFQTRNWPLVSLGQKRASPLDRFDAGGNVHCVVGKLSFDETKLWENAEAMLRFIRSLKPATSKGHYVRNISLGATMMPGISVAL